MRRIACALACTAAFAASAANARAATDGQWVTVDSEYGTAALVTLNPITRHDLPLGLHTIYTAPVGDRIHAPRWSPDGNRIAFAETGPGGSRILAYDLASGQVAEVAPDGTAPSWSPDGTRIAFVRGGALLTRSVAGGDEQPLPIDGAGVRDVAWSPDGDLLALWVDDHLDLATLDGQDRETVDDDVTGGAAWAPDSDSLVYTQSGTDGARLLSRSLVDGSVAELPFADGPAGTDLEPDFAPDGAALLYPQRVRLLPGLAVFEGDSATAIGLPTLVPSEPDWQPCVAGVTVTCTSVTPVPPPPTLAQQPAPNCPATTVVTAVAGVSTSVVPACSGALRYGLVGRPAHGSVTLRPNGFAYRPPSTFSGQVTFTYQAFGGLFAPPSAVARVVVTVLPRPAAPRLAVPHRPRLDRHDRVLVRGTCDRACVVKLHLRIRLHSGRVVNGRSVTASAPAGGTVTLRLPAGRLPRHARFATVHAVGRLSGADRLARAFSLAVRH